MNAYDSGAQVLAQHSVIGMLDVGALQQQFNGLKQVPVSVARIFVQSGTDAINHAISVANSKHSIITGDFPGGNDRAQVQGKLQWHANNLQSFTDPNAMYTSGDDLKHWVFESFAESNAADEGAAWIDSVANSMWTAVKQAMAALPKEVSDATQVVASGLGNFVRTTASSLVESATGVPLWVIISGGLVAVAGVGFGVYKILAGPSGGTLVKAYTGGRLRK